MTTSSAAATTSAVTSGRRVGASLSASPLRGGPESSSLKLPGGGPKLLLLTWSALGAGAGRSSGRPGAASSGCLRKLFSALLGRPPRAQQRDPHETGHDTGAVCR